MDREGYSFNHGPAPIAPGMPEPRPSPMPVQSLVPWTLPRLTRALAGWVMAETALPETAQTNRHA